MAKIFKLPAQRDRLEDFGLEKGVTSAEDPQKTSETRTLPLEELLQRCREGGDQAAWNEFFTRFNWFILKTIHNTMIRQGFEPLPHHDDAVNDVRELVVKKALQNRLLNGLEQPAALPSWVKTSVENITKDWLRKQNCRKNVLSRYEVEYGRSLDEPLGEDSEMTLADIIGSNEAEARQEEREHQDRIDALLSDVEEIGEEHALIVKAFCIFYDSFSDGQLALIAARRNKTILEIQAEVDQLKNDLVKRNEKRIKKTGLDAVQWGMIRKMERQLQQMKKDPLVEQKDLLKKISEIRLESEKLEKSRKKDTALIKPKNKEIAKLLGISEEAAENLSVKMKRIRDKLIDLDGKRAFQENL